MDKSRPILESSTFDYLRSMMGARFAILLKLYLQDTSERLAQFEPITDQGADRDRIVLMAHSIKSSSAHIGALALSDRASELENLAQTGGSVPHMSDSVQHLKILFEQTRDQIVPLIASS